MRYPMRGVTLVELVVVVVVIGILAATVTISFNASKQHGVTVQADEFRRNLSRIQLLAISQGKRLQLSVATGGYTVYECPDAACGGTLSTVVMGPVPLVNAEFTVGSTLDFDTLGRPQSGGSLITTGPAPSYTLRGSGNCVDVTVLLITGFARSGAPYDTC